MIKTHNTKTEPNDESDVYFPFNYNLRNEKTRRAMIDVMIHYANTGQKELIPDVPAEYCQDGSLIFSSVLKWLTKEGFPVDNGLIYYYNRQTEYYVYCGKNYLSNITVSHQDLYEEEGRKQIFIKVRFPEIRQESLKDLHLQWMTSETQQETVTMQSLSSDELENNQRPIRNRKRLLRDIYKLVAEWRKMYNGYYDPITNEFVQMTLDEAAKVLEVPKKSLDDYYLIIRQGKHYGFNFEAHKDEKFGVLRTFVKQKKAEEQGLTKNSQVREELEDNTNFTTSKCRKSKKISKS